MSADVRPIAASELPEWLRAVNTGFLRPDRVTESDLAQRAEHTDLDRTLGAFDADTGRCAATLRSFAQELTVPGGRVVPASAVTNVAVLPTHRRRGLLTRMMAAELAAAQARGDVVSTLISAEYPIYGRYGYGSAASITEWEIDVSRAGLDPRWSGPADGARIELVDVAEAHAIGPALHERLRAVSPGTVSRNERWWRLACGLEETSLRPYKDKFHAVYRTADGEPAGLAVYTADDHWTDGKVPLNTVQVTELIAVTPDAERALWHFLCSIDWVLKVRTGYRAPDDLLPHLLPDPRSATIVTASDFLWVRVIDVVRALGARTYAVPGVLVLEVTDAAGPAAGRYRLDAGTGECKVTEEPADLRLDVSELGSLYLGDESAVRLGALGRITEERPGALALADAVFRTARRPWCPTTF
ncbi:MULTISPECIES: GNAT family N-acetyltransferase [unclassified Streptomyces]|uniref:GNAT family N-acetyltransferase n=1 Tax=unclassified Streptomyces TaxID=2593676 RepID=UPI002252A100|nr:MULTISPECIES: GNAT family N-acetyltransferase [unclassified Streptomyces]MCX5146984.1 GNAT family N-acetyltransferase [Streptomyces sp. NBC_00320]WSN50155.1 GNAT family N-acetyltransferase [Streptomyces sp. NBC_01296]WSW60423.1 GNAT family N-acetyltransferase [Streptomyces sp. NBC_00998]